MRGKMAKIKSTNSEGLVQFIKFAVVGVANTAVDWIVFYILINTFMGGEDTIAKALSFLVAMLNSYLFNTIWTFKKEYQNATGKNGNGKSAIFGKFAVVSFIGWGVNVLAFSLASNHISFVLFGKSTLLPLVIASGSAILWNFFGNKFWTYKK